MEKPFCAGTGGLHEWEFLRHEERQEHYGTGRLRKVTPVDVFYCRRCLEYHEKVAGVQDASVGTMSTTTQRGY
jgi:hypothetical protein